MKQLYFLIFILLSNVSFSQSTYIPDNNFEQALIDLGYDTGSLDNYVLTSNINTITNLSLLAKYISNLTGIEDFTALEVLELGYNNLTSVDLSSNLALVDLKASVNNLTSLDLSSNTALTHLEVKNNVLNSLTLNNNLVSINVQRNNLTSLNLDGFTALTTATLIENNLTSLSVTNCSSLSELQAQQNSLTSIDLSTNTSLSYLILNNNNLNAIDVSNNINLSFFSIGSNNISSIDISNNLALDNLSIERNILTALDVSVNTLLTQLSCFDNNLETLDISNNPSIFVILCSENNLTSLNLKNGNNTAMNLVTPYLDNNPNLYCIEVDDVDYSNANWTIVDPQSSFSEDCSTLSLEENLFDTKISVFPNPFVNEIIINLNSNLEIIDNTIFNMQGKMVLKTKLNTIDTHNLVSGIYLLKVKAKNGIFTKKIIKL